MSIVLILAAVGCWTVAVMLMAVSQSAIHEIEAAMAFIAGILFLLSALLCDVLRAVNTIAADITWYKATKLTENYEQQESRRSRSQR